MTLKNTKPPAAAAAGNGGNGNNGNVQKEPSMVLQKQMLAGYFDELSAAPENGRKVAYTFVPGNLTELVRCFDIIPVYPEINALQNAMRKRSDEFISEAERYGHSEDVCSYVKCDVGMMLKGNIGPTGKPLPSPDLLLLSYTGCFVFMKWFENLKGMYDCPAVMLHVPYQADGEITAEMRDYVARQIREDLIPVLERISGVKFDEDRLRGYLRNSVRAEDGLVQALESARNRPSPIDAYFAGVYYVGPIFTAFRGTEDCVTYYDCLNREIDARVRAGKGPVTPEGPLDDQKYRLVVEGPPNWTHFRDFWKQFHEQRAVVVASTYTKVGGLYDNGFRHDPDRPIETLADYCLGCYTNLSLPRRTELLERYLEEYDADGRLIHSVKSCNSFSAGQLLILREIEKRTGRPAGFLESDLVDSRYFSPANIKNRLESYLQMIEQKRAARNVS
jgi:benzoyl-CoA reductase subunit B